MTFALHTGPSQGTREAAELEELWQRVELAPQSSFLESLLDATSAAVRNLLRSPSASVGIVALGAPVYCLLLCAFVLAERWSALQGEVRSNAAALFVYETDDEAMQAASSLRDLVEESELRFFSREEALSEAALLFDLPSEMLDAYDYSANPLPAFLELRGLSEQALGGVRSRLRERGLAPSAFFSNVEELRASEELLRPLAVGSAGALVLLLCALFAFVAAGTKLSFLSRHSEIVVSELLGTKEQRRRTEFLIEGGLLGVCSVLGGTVLFILVSVVALAISEAQFQGQLFTDFSAIAIIIVALLSALLIVGMFSAFTLYRARNLELHLLESSR